MKFKRILKFLIITGICYLILASNVFHIGEKLLNEETNYLDQDIPQNQDIEQIFFEAEKNNEQTGHFSAEAIYENIYNNLCKRTIICEKIDFNGEYGTQEKYIYTKATEVLVQHIDTYGTQPKPIKNVLSKIDINKDAGTRRGYATRDTIIINLWSIKSKKEFAELLSHEIGHIVDLWYIKWTSSKKEKNYTEFGKAVFAINDPSLKFYQHSRSTETIRKAEAKQKDFCSGYGMSDPFEDFSECFNLYLNHNIFFKEIAKSNTILKNKYNFIANILSGQHLASNTQELKHLKTNKERRPRDTTKITNN